MDYEKFKKELEENDDWERIAYRDHYNVGDNPTRPRVPGKPASKRWLTSIEGKHALNDAWFNSWTGQEDPINAFRGSGKGDRVNSPSHYTRGKQEVIDTIEESIQDAPTPIQGMLQAQVLKYMLRVWLKDNPLEDLQKAQWYLTRLIDKLEKEQ